MSLARGTGHRRGSMFALSASGRTILNLTNARSTFQLISDALPVSLPTPALPQVRLLHAASLLLSLCERCSPSSSFIGRNSHWRVEKPHSCCNVGVAVLTRGVASANIRRKRDKSALKTHERALREQQLDDQK